VCAAIGIHLQRTVTFVRHEEGLSLSLSPPIYISTSLAESGWSNVDYQREINRGQIRSRRRALARFALFTTRRRDADASLSTVYVLYRFPKSQIRRA